MNRRFLVRWFLIVSFVGAAAIGVVVYLRWQPGELEASIRDDLILRGRIGESAKVTVLKRLQLFDAASHRIDYVTVCIEDESKYALAHMRRLAQHPRDKGGLWTTVHTSWQWYDTWPTADQIKEFDAGDEDYVKYLLVKGWLPRPADKIDFQAKRLFIRLAEPIDGFDPNEGIDAFAFASLMVRDQGDAGRQRLGQFTFAPFHPPRWFPAAEGRQAVLGYIDLLETQIERSKDAQQRSALAVDLETLRVVEKRLDAIEAHDGRFYFLADDLEP